MRKLFLGVALLTLVVFPLFAQDAQVSEDDKAAIEKAALDYVAGYYEANAERVARGLSDELNKVMVQKLPNGREFLNYATKAMLVESANAGFFKKPDQLENIKVEILDVFKNIASVRIDSPDFIDMAHIAKINGEWRVVNVLWAMNR